MLRTLLSCRFHSTASRVNNNTTMRLNDAGRRLLYYKNSEALDDHMENHDEEYDSDAPPLSRAEKGQVKLMSHHLCSTWVHHHLTYRSKFIRERLLLLLSIHIWISL